MNDLGVPQILFVLGVLWLIFAPRNLDAAASPDDRRSPSTNHPAPPTQP